MDESQEPHNTNIATETEYLGTAQRTIIGPEDLAEEVDVEVEETPANDDEEESLLLDY